MPVGGGQELVDDGLGLVDDGLGQVGDELEQVGDEREQIDDENVHGEVLGATRSSVRSKRVHVHRGALVDEPPLRPAQRRCIQPANIEICSYLKKFVIFT